MSARSNIIGRGRTDIAKAFFFESSQPFFVDLFCVTKTTRLFDDYLSTSQGLFVWCFKSLILYTKKSTFIADIVEILK